MRNKLKCKLKFVVGNVYCYKITKASDVEGKNANLLVK